MDIVTSTALQSYVFFAMTLCLSEAMFLFGAERRRQFPLRITLSVAAVTVLETCFGFVVGTVVVACSYSLAARIAMNILAYTLIFCATFAACIVCFSEKPYDLLFCCLSGYMIQHIADSIPTDWIVPYGYTAVHIAVRSALFIAFYMIAYIVFGRRFVSLLGEAKSVGLHRNMLSLMSALCLFIAVCVGYIAFEYSSESPTLYALLSVCQAAFCIFVLWAQYMILVSRKNIRDAMVTERLREMERKQYEFVKSSIDAVNIKFHDIRHMLKRKQTLPDSGGDYLKEIEEGIDIYDSQIKTGNAVLDVILTEKSMRCYSLGVRFSCLADGSLLSGMADADMYSVFGNAIENALEYLETLPEERRVLKVYVRKYGEGFVSITVKNRYEGSTVAGDPSTTKDDPVWHGFGIKSMRSVAAEYGGTLGILTENETFTVNILIPLPVSKRKEKR